MCRIVNILLNLGMIGLIINFTSFTEITSPNELSEWKAPPSSNALKNPLTGNTLATTEGKKLFNSMCTICHGNSGKGDGMAGMSLNPRPSNLTTEKIQSQTDGAIYWKLTEGRPPMASYKTTLKEEQRWQLVNYIRTLKK